MTLKVITQGLENALVNNGGISMSISKRDFFSFFFLKWVSGWLKFGSTNKLLKCFAAWEPWEGMASYWRDFTFSMCFSVCLWLAFLWNWFGIFVSCLFLWHFHLYSLKLSAEHPQLKILQSHMPVLKWDIKKPLNKTGGLNWLNYEKYEHDIQYITALLSY